MSSWFAGVPFSISLCEAAFLPGGQALESAELGDALEDRAHGERPDPDWPAVAVLEVTRLQLQQMQSIIGDIIDDGITGWSPDEAADGLTLLVTPIDDDGGSLLADVAALGEDLQLLEGLGGQL